MLLPAVLWWMILGAVLCASWDTLRNLAATVCGSDLIYAPVCPCLRLCLVVNPSWDPIHIDSFTSLLPTLCQSLNRHLQYTPEKLLWTSLLMLACMCVLSLSGWWGSLCPWTSDTCYPKDLWHFISLFLTAVHWVICWPPALPVSSLKMQSWNPARSCFPRPCVFIALAFRLRANFQMCLLWNRLSEGPLWG